MIHGKLSGRRRTLADDMAFMPRHALTAVDTDAELYTYPECIDQTQIGQIGMMWGGAFADDDMEIDDGE